MKTRLGSGEVVRGDLVGGREKEKRPTKKEEMLEQALLLPLMIGGSKGLGP